jgi:hypothetical protein
MKIWGCLYRMREDTHVNILPSPKGLVLEIEHELSGWTSWLELIWSGECLRSWPVATHKEFRLLSPQEDLVGAAVRGLQSPAKCVLAEKDVRAIVEVLVYECGW